jgi:UDP-2,4-diacetamido-2,4,6-trideoxy-beta-L-altropyranose hydrolase
MQATVPIRCDGGRLIGSGHVMRCRTLARRLRGRGIEALFLCRRQQEDLIDLLASEFNVQALPFCPGSASESTLPDDPATLLGCSQDQDADDTLAAIDAAAPAAIPWLAVDHYGLAAPWHRRVLAGLRRRGHEPQLLVIDDLADRDLEADLLLDQNRLGRIGREAYGQRLPHGCLCLLGPQNALLGDEFALLHPLLPTRRAPLKRLLIFFGGSDRDNLSERCLASLLEPTPLPLKIDVVLGGTNDHRGRLEALTAQHPHVRLHGPLPSLAGLIAQADLAIGAGGVTSWERACLALPALVSAVATNQQAVIRTLVEAGAAVDLGPAHQLGATTVRTAVKHLLKDARALEELSRRAASLGDGQGGARLLAAMFGPRLPFSLRAATPADEEIWWHWANDPASRAASFRSDPISIAGHHRWFFARLADPQARLLIAHTADGLPLGSVRFERLTTTAERTQWLVSLALEPACRGHGLGVPLLQEAIGWLRRGWAGRGELLAEVKPDNLASIRLFTRAEFEPCPPRRPEALCFRWTTPEAEEP